ncbi:SWIM zinc finger family protein [Amycolatopsis sp. NPDC003731]
MRADLLALTPDALAALANRGLVKRAQKDIDAGRGPALETAEDGEVRGRFPDGVEVVFPPEGALAAAACTCGAPGVCRHRIAVVLGYQHHPGAAPEFTAWSPGDIDDEALTAEFGARAVTTARRAWQAGPVVRLRRPTAADPVAVAELPAATVRFLVPAELGYAHTDAADRAQQVAIAVWAFREADTRGLTDADTRFAIGGPTPAPAPVPSAPALEVVARVLHDGVANASPVLRASIGRIATDLAESGLRWPAAAMSELGDQLDAYAARSARHRVEWCAELLAEIPARFRASGPPSLVLGTEEQAETKLRRIRLTALGVRISGSPGERRAQVYFTADGSVLALTARWETGTEQVTGHDLAGRRIAGTTLGVLAAANVVSETAVRSASRALRLGTSRTGAISITPIGAAWDDLPAVITDFKAEANRLANLPPKLIRPRVEAEAIAVVRITEVCDLGYHPGAQRLDAIIADAHGTQARITATHSSACPGRLDALNSALAANPTQLSGALTRTAGELRIDPVAIRTKEGIHLPDLAADDRTEPLGPPPPPEHDPLREALAEAESVLAEAAHRGLAHAPPTSRTRTDRAAKNLKSTGFTTTAAELSKFAEQWTPEAWTRAQIRVLTTAELR